MLVVDTDLHPRSDQLTPVLARRPYPELPRRLPDCACEVRARRVLSELDAVLHAIIGDRLAGDEPPTVGCIVREITAKLGVGRLASPFRGIENFAVRPMTDHFAVAF